MTQAEQGNDYLGSHTHVDDETSLGVGVPAATQFADCDEPLPGRSELQQLHHRLHELLFNLQGYALRACRDVLRKLLHELVGHPVCDQASDHGTHLGDVPKLVWRHRFQVRANSFQVDVVQSFLNAGEQMNLDHIGHDGVLVNHNMRKIREQACRHVRPRVLRVVDDQRQGLGDVTLTASQVQ